MRHGDFLHVFRLFQRFGEAAVRKRRGGVGVRRNVFDQKPVISRFENVDLPSGEHIRKDTLYVGDYFVFFHGVVFVEIQVCVVQNRFDTVADNHKFIAEYNRKGGNHDQKHFDENAHSLSTLSFFRLVYPL